jgi:hypothetical protein
METGSSSESIERAVPDSSNIDAQSFDTAHINCGKELVEFAPLFLARPGMRLRA